MVLGFPRPKRVRARSRQSAAQRPMQRPAGVLSARELEVLRHLATGMPNKQIARELGISESTVRNHLSLIFKKLSATNRVEAVMSALRVGLVAFLSD